MKKQIKNKKITIDDLAGMTKRGFDGLRVEISKNFATKDDFNVLKKDVGDIKDDLKNMEDTMLTGFDKILGKLDKIHPHT